MYIITQQVDRISFYRHFNMDDNFYLRQNVKLRYCVWIGDKSETGSAPYHTTYVIGTEFMR